MKYVFLSQDFYDRYNKNEYPEILTKDTRPYIMLLIKIKKLNFALPFRSNIPHKNAFFTVYPKGIDFTKSVVISDVKYILIPQKRSVVVTHAEHNILSKSKSKIINHFMQYLQNYERAIKNNASIALQSPQFKYSTLKYFHQELQLINRGKNKYKKKS
jgi:protein AbiQ